MPKKVLIFIKYWQKKVKLAKKKVNFQEKKIFPQIF